MLSADVFPASRRLEGFGVVGGFQVPLLTNKDCFDLSTTPTQNANQLVHIATLTGRQFVPTCRSRSQVDGPAFLPPRAPGS